MVYQQTHKGISLKTELLHGHTANSNDSVLVNKGHAPHIRILKTQNQQSLQAIPTTNPQCRRPTLFHSSHLLLNVKSTQLMEQQIHLEGQNIEWQMS